tara:strand:- start:1062 stop:1382 length:321 start_codon:yes stop_codon:yes gene_type:complete
MFENSSPSLNGFQSELKSSSVVFREIVTSSPSSKIDSSHFPPFVARRMSDDRERSGVSHRVPVLCPLIDKRELRVNSSLLNKESRDGLFHICLLGFELSDSVKGRS